MICDHIGCKLDPQRGIKVVVPAKDIFAIGHDPLTMMTTLHYCELHKGEVKLGDLMSARVRREFEAIAKQKRPLDFRCNFEVAHIVYVLITTPEYRQFMSRIDIRKLVATHL